MYTFGFFNNRPYIVTGGTTVMFFIPQSTVTYCSLTLAGAYTHDRVRVVNEFRCYEAKIEESEKAGSAGSRTLPAFSLSSIFTS